VDDETVDYAEDAETVKGPSTSQVSQGAVIFR
jgi:hypothetical protein